MSLKCDLSEARMALVELSLTSVTYGDYLVVLSSDFDVEIEGEPHLALMLLFNLRSGPQGGQMALHKNLIPSIPWIAPSWRVRGGIQGKEGIKFCSVV